MVSNDKSLQFELTNNDRKYLGLDIIEPHWERVKLTDEIYLYFDGDNIVKKISISKNSYKESKLNEKTENREFLLPKTKRGKPKKLNFTSIGLRNGIGLYFKYDINSIIIGNYTNQTTYYSTGFEDITINSFKDLRKWIDKFIFETTDHDLTEINRYKVSKRKNVKLNEGDFFTFKVDRRNYGFGRILLDIRKIRNNKDFTENKNYGLKNLMGQPLVIKIYHKISNTQDIDLESLKKYDSFPSQYIMDNVLFYGEYEIIGNIDLLDHELDFPISYSRSISGLDKDTVYLQQGLIYKEKNISEYNKFLNAKDVKNPYRNESIGFGLKLNKKIMNECINQKSNLLYWNISNAKRDLRNPKYSSIKDEIFDEFGLDKTLE